MSCCFVVFVLGEEFGFLVECDAEFGLNGVEDFLTVGEQVIGGVSVFVYEH